MPAASRAVKQVGLKLPTNANSYVKFLNDIKGLPANRKLLANIEKAEIDGEYEKLLRKHHADNDSVVVTAMEKVCPLRLPEAFRYDS